MMVTLFIVLTLAALREVTGANILALMTTASPSHHIWNRSLMLELAARGHHVTVLSPDSEKSPIPNYKNILIEGAYEYIGSETDVWDFEAMAQDHPVTGLLKMYDWGIHICQQDMVSKGVQKLMQSKNETFDLIIVEVVCGECHLGFIHHFQYPPVLGITAYSSPPWASDIIGNPQSPAYIPSLHLPLSDKMSFFQRAKNLLMYITAKCIRTYHLLPKMDAMLRQHFGESVPSASELESRINIIMVNTHESTDYPRPLVPGMIPVGGMHIKPPKPLPEDLQQFLDSAPNGVIFFSLGSNVKSNSLKESKIKAMLAAFKELPHRILWKWESDVLPGKPDNVKVGKWLPQNDILGHPNVLMFITHGGQLSTQEALYHGVPVVAIPFMADQHINTLKAEVHDIGKKLDYSSLTKESVLEVVNEVIGNHSYRHNAKRLSAIFRDQPQTPLDRAVFWTEYAIRHKGAPHLQSAAVNMPWYQLLLLDVVAVLALATVVILAAIYVIVRSLLKMLLGGNKVKAKQQ